MEDITSGALATVASWQRVQNRRTVKDTLGGWCQSCTTYPQRGPEGMHIPYLL